MVQAAEIDNESNHTLLLSAQLEVGEPDASVCKGSIIFISYQSNNLTLPSDILNRAIFSLEQLKIIEKSMEGLRCT